MSQPSSPRRIQPAWYILVLVALVGLLLVGVAVKRNRDYVEHQQVLVRQSTTGAARLLERFVEEVRHRVAVFAQEESSLLARLAERPHDQALHARLEAKVARHFPAQSAFTVAGPQGRPLLADFEGDIGQICRRDLRGFAAGEHPQEIFIHPNPNQYHFDVMGKWPLPDGGQGVFFVSFLPDHAAAILSSSQLAHHQLLLLRQDRPRLIEITAGGARIDLDRPFQLSIAEQERIAYREPIDGARWILADLPEAGLAAEHRRQVAAQSLAVFAIFVALGIASARLLRREEHRRSRAEESLQEANQRLEERVRQRTRELAEINTRLEQEVAERERTQRALEASEQRYALAIQGSNDGIWDWDLDSGAIFFSQRFRAMLGVEEDELQQPEDWFARVHPEDRQRLLGAIERVHEGLSDHIQVEYRIQRPEGGERWLLTRGAVVWGDDGHASRIAGSHTDVTRRKEMEQRLAHDGLYDRLTGLPNWALLIDRIAHALRRLQREGAEGFAVLFVDLDGFMQINADHGHAAADDLLVAAADRMGQFVRPGDTLAHLGGDDFAILAEGSGDAEAARQLAERVCSCLAEPFEIKGRTLTITASVGVAISHAAEVEPDAVLRDGEAAMYQARSVGRGRVAVHGSGQARTSAPSSCTDRR